MRPGRNTNSTCGLHQQAGDQTGFLSACRSSHTHPASSGALLAVSARSVKPCTSHRALPSNIKCFYPLVMAGRSRPLLGGTGLHFFFFVASKRSSPSRSPAFWGAAIGTARWYNTAVFVRVTPGRSPVGRSRAFRDRPTMQAQASKILR